MNHDLIKRAAKSFLTGVVISELVVGRINAKRCNRNAALVRTLQQENAELSESLHASMNQSDYLAGILNRHEVPCDEFDMIALNSFLP